MKKILRIFPRRTSYTPTDNMVVVDEAPGDKILDTHAGSASSLIACYQSGFDYMGFEIDAEYYRLAQERLAVERQKIDLFHTNK